MRILIAYATTEGQTRKICRFAADRLFAEGHSVELLNVEDSEGLDPARFDAAILAGSVHVGRLQEALIRFAAGEGKQLSARPVLYLQVSLAAAGTDSEEWQALGRIARETETAFGWTPSRTEHVAGAFRFSEYDFFKSWAMRWIAAQHGQTVSGSGDREYTDWTKLGSVIDRWAEEATGQTR